MQRRLLPFGLIGLGLAPFWSKSRTGDAERFAPYKRPSVSTIVLKPTRRKIPLETWEQIHTAYAGGIGLREIARNMGISQGTVLAYAKRQGWSQQIQTARENALAKQSDAIKPVQSVPESLAAILSERKERSKLGLSKYAAEAAERAGESDGDLGLSRKVRDVAAVHQTVWPEQHQENILTLSVLNAVKVVRD
jgi:hypothetical protein